MQDKKGRSSCVSGLGGGQEWGGAGDEADFLRGEHTTTKTGVLRLRLKRYWPGDPLLSLRLFFFYCFIIKGLL